MKSIQKLLEEVTCSDDKQSDEDGLSFNSSGEDDCLEKNAHVPDSDNYMSGSDNLQESANRKKSKFDVWVRKYKTTWWRKNCI